MIVDCITVTATKIVPVLVYEDIRGTLVPVWSFESKDLEFCFIREANATRMQNRLARNGYLVMKTGSNIT